MRNDSPAKNGINSVPPVPNFASGTQSGIKTKLLIHIVIASLIIVIGILYITGIFSRNNTPDITTATTTERGIAITPRSAKAFLTDPDIERWAVIVGISDYKNNPQITDLKYADCDATAFYDFLVSAKGGCFKPENIQLLLNEKATVSNLRYALGTFLGRTADKDLVVIYMAGHGAPDTRKWENLYFLTYDADPDSLPNTAYPMWEMETALQRFIKSKRVIVVTDACHSAAVSGGMMAMRGNEGYRVNEYMKKLAESREGCTFITASRAGEGSQESPKWGGGHGVFTHFLLEGLKGKADYNSDSFITMKEAYDYLYSKVQRESENGQTPFASAYLDNSIPMGICEPDKLGIQYGIPLGITSKPKPSEIDKFNEWKRNKTANENKPDEAETYFKQGNTYLNPFLDVDYQKAIKSYKEAIRIKPDYAEAYYRLGDAYGESGDYQKAIESYKEAIRIKPDYVYAHYDLGYTYYISGDTNKAIESYKEAIRLKPDYAEAHYNLGLAYGTSDDYKKAIESFQQAIRIQPDYAIAHLNLGIAYARSGDYKKAIELYKEAIRIKPDYAEAHYNLGFAYGKSGDSKKAIESYKEVIRIKPDYVEAHYILGLHYLLGGDRSSALDEYNILKGLNKEKANELFNLIYGK